VTDESTAPAHNWTFAVDQWRDKALSEVYAQVFRSALVVDGCTAMEERSWHAGSRSIDGLAARARQEEEAMLPAVAVWEERQPLDVSFIADIAAVFLVLLLKRI